MRTLTTRPYLWLAGILALAVALPTPAQAQKKQKRRGFLLQLSDETGLLPQPPVVTLKGNLGTTRTTTPKDDGVSPDVKADDRLYVQPVPTFFDPKVKIEVRAGDKVWHAQAEFKPTDVRARVVVILEPNGKTQTNIHTDATPPPNLAPGPPPGPGPGPKKREAEFITQDEVSFSSKLGIGFLLWVIAFLLFAASLVLIRHSRKGDGDSSAGDEDDEDEDTFDDVEDEDDDEDAVPRE